MTCNLEIPVRFWMREPIGRSGVIAVCRNCKIDFKYGRNSTGKYCSNICQQSFQYKEYIFRWKNGEETGCVGKTLDISSHIRRYLRETRGTSCQECGWDERHPYDGNPLTEVDHINGDSSDNREDNLRILCPNCHSKTPTFRSRNKRSKRIRK